MLINTYGMGSYGTFLIIHPYNPVSKKKLVPKIEETGVENKLKNSTEKKGTIIDKKI